MMTRPLSDADRWQAVLGRDRQADAAFVYGVRSTRVYCRPSCPSRRPRRDRVEFFPAPVAAEQAGFRPCRRCRPREVRRGPAVELVERACRHLEQAVTPPTLEVLARELGVSPGHLQRVFTRVAGVSPKGYADALRAARLRSSLRRGEGVSGALYRAGYGSPSRIYEASTAPIGMTPAAYRKGGRGLHIGFAIGASPLGTVLVGGTERGLCFVALGDSEAVLERSLRAEFPGATVYREGRGLGTALAAVLNCLSGKAPDPALPLDIRGTAFQRMVWEALRHIPVGGTITYAELARRIGRPGAARAVAGACAHNPLAVVVPCHRVVRSDGGLGGYRWGVQRKAELLRQERGE
ncbi:MAG TPA: bifunctional DNA-binding transcriptional regulator/O6-methylguanine-DNA methyltransferase Ada [Gemmatimonadales bacterium]|nr:bifunctional DNA-binding transcriptional regulator/O6-methylguanine-DNA methyltransferase Ada [Gemmatimonadales bacterium]